METFYELRERYAGPPVNVEAIIRGMGLELEKSSLGDQLSGILRKDGDSYKVIVNKDHHYYRQRFTMAHELAHYVLHQDLLDKGINDDRAYRSVSYRDYMNKLIGPKQETEANRLAALILTPEASIRGLFADGKTNPDELSRIFQVSKQAMEIRLKGLGLTTN